MPRQRLYVTGIDFLTGMTVETRVITSRVAIERRLSVIPVRRRGQRQTNFCVIALR